MRLAKGGGESSWRERGEESIGEKKKVCLPPPSSISHSGKRRNRAQKFLLSLSKNAMMRGEKCCFFAQKDLQNWNTTLREKIPPRGLWNCAEKEKKKICSTLWHSQIFNGPSLPLPQAYTQVAWHPSPLFSLKPPSLLGSGISLIQNPDSLRLPLSLFFSSAPAPAEKRGWRNCLCRGWGKGSCRDGFGF